MDRRKLRFPEFDGDRLTTRIRHADREQLRTVSRKLGVSESELVREAIEVAVEAILEQPASAQHDSSDIAGSRAL